MEIGINATKRKEDMSRSPKKTIVIVGGGFGGINAAKNLVRNQFVDVILIDRRNYHLFQPLLYQVATAGLSPAEIATPIRAILGRYQNCQIYLADVENLDLSTSVVHSEFRDFHYDYLILACGVQHSYFGHDQWETSAPGLKTLEQGLEIRRRIFLSFELAEREEQTDLQRALLTFVIVGAGPTGVELAGTLGEISRFALSKEFHHIDPKNTKIILIEASSRILPSFSEANAKRAMTYLNSLGVDVWTNSLVTNINNDGVFLKNQFIPSKTVLWAAGVKPTKINQTLNVALDKVGRVYVEPDLSLKDFKNVFVIGDMAHCLGKDGKPHPGVAAVAIQQGKAVAQNILADLQNRPRKSFIYIDKGQMATIGRSKAIMEWRNLRVGGFLAWLFWLFVHIYYLIGFKNRVLVMIQWAFSFVTYRRGARIIHKADWRSID